MAGLLDDFIEQVSHVGGGLADWVVDNWIIVVTGFILLMLIVTGILQTVLGWFGIVIF